MTRLLIMAFLFFLPRVETCPIAVAAEGDLLVLSEDSFSQLQFQMRLAYEEEIPPLIRKYFSPYINPPKGMDPVMHMAFRAIWRLLKDEIFLIQELQSFELEVFQHAKKRKIDLVKALEEKLLELEMYYGFEKPIIVTKFLLNADFLKLVHAGHPVEDMYYVNQPHSVKIHRIQGVIGARYLDKLFGERDLYLRLYKYMGDPTVLPNLDWSLTGLDTEKPKHPEDEGALIDLHGFAYDVPYFNKTHAIRPSDFTNPDFYADLRKFLPALGKGWN